MVGRSIVAGLGVAIAEILAVFSTAICSPLGGTSRDCNLLTDIGRLQLCHWHERKQSRKRQHGLDTTGYDDARMSHAIRRRYQVGTDAKLQSRFAARHQNGGFAAIRLQPDEIVVQQSNSCPVTMEIEIKPMSSLSDEFIPH